MNRFHTEVNMVLFFIPFFRVAPDGWKGEFNDATCCKRNIDGVEGDSLGGSCDTLISTGSVKDVSVVIWTGSKNIPCFCKGSSS